MHIDAIEKKWIYLTFLLTFTGMGVLTAYAVMDNINPPSNVETIDSAALHLSKEFNEDALGVKQEADGSIRVTMVAARYGFFPQKLVVPVDTPVTIRIASADVLHGIHTVDSNFNTMVVPGYVSEVNTTFMKTGVFPMFCNEYCGLGHDFMWARLTVVPKEKFKL